LLHIYHFLLETGRGTAPTWLTAELQQPDPAAVITQTALTGRSALCEQALDLFVSLYGAEAGNLALKVMATGGVFIGGGIAPKILQRLMMPLFMKAFIAKGRMQSLLEGILVRVIVQDRTALRGAVTVPGGTEYQRPLSNANEESHRPREPVDVIQGRTRLCSPLSHSCAALCHA
jgi:glucokinase